MYTLNTAYAHEIILVIMLAMVVVLGFALVSERRKRRWYQQRLGETLFPGLVDESAKFKSNSDPDELEDELEEDEPEPIEPGSEDMDGEVIESEDDCQPVTLTTEPTTYPSNPDGSVTVPTAGSGTRSIKATHAKRLNVDRIDFINALKAVFAKHTQLNVLATAVTMHFGEKFHVRISGMHGTAPSISFRLLGGSVNNQRLIFTTSGIIDCNDSSSYGGYVLDKALATIRSEKTVSGAAEKVLELFKEF